MTVKNLVDLDLDQKSNTLKNRSRGMVGVHPDKQAVVAYFKTSMR